MSQPNFDKSSDGLIPVIIQNVSSRKVLMLGYMNEEAYHKTVEENIVTFYSRSKQRLWTKGESSKNYLHVVDIELDCDQDTLLILANPDGPTCHTGAESCFKDESAKGFLGTLESIIANRKKNPTSTSYTNKLFDKGTKKIAQKVGEEATEVILEAMDGKKDLLKEETSDLLFHLLVLLADQDVKLEEIEEVLRNRHK